MVVRRIGELAAGTLRPVAVRDDRNLIISVNTCAAEYSVEGGRLVVRCAWQGRDETGFEGRRVIVDDDTWLALCPTTPVTCRVASEREVRSLTIVYRPGFAQSVLQTLLTPDDRLLARDESAALYPLPFAPQLHPHDRSVTPVLMFIKRYSDMGLDDELWYEEQLAFLLERLLSRHRQILDRTRAIPARRSTTRREIMRRIALSTDFIHSSYEHTLTLDDMAGAACLSRHHFLRLFKAVHGVTPHEFLQRKRTLVAARLLRQSECGVEEIVQRVGFDSRSTLFRALRRFHGVTPRQCRRSAAASSTALSAYAVA